MDTFHHQLQIREISNTTKMKEDYIPRIKKYVRHIILPKYPEIIDFDVVDKYNTNVSFLEFDFVVDGSDEQQEIEIEDSISDMFRYLSIERIVYGINFKTS